MSRIVLHIDRLVLHGIPAADANSLAQALRETLARQLSLSPLPALGDRYRLDAGCLRIAPDDDAAALGQAIAERIVARGLS